MDVFLLHFLGIIIHYMYNKREYQNIATKEATEAKEEAAAKAPIKEEATAKALEKEDQGEELKTRWCEGISHVQFEFWIFSKKNFSIKTKKN